MGVLTNTIWKLNKNVLDPKSDLDTDWPSTCGTTNIAYVNYHFGFSYEAVTTGTEVGWHINYSTNNPLMSSTWAVSINASEEDYWYNGSENQWYYYDGTPSSRTPWIWITDGPDVDNYELYDWLDYNATRMDGPVSIEYGDDTVVTYAENDGYTLETAGKILASDITVTVDYSQAVEIGTFTSNGTYYPENKYGFNPVIVNVPSSGTPTYTNLGTSSTNLSGAYVTVDSTNTYVNSITISSGKSLTVVNGGTVNVTNTGTTNINGGNTNRGVQVTDMLAIVDGYTVTDNNGDLLTPTYNSTTKALTYPAAYTVAGTTAQYTLSGEVTSINGALVRDTTAVSGSGTASSSYSNTYLAKWNSATTLSTGPHITISTSTPGSSSGVAGDIWYQVL